MRLEKRKHRRVKTHIDCIVFDNENKEEVFGEITDISAHGIGIKFKDLKYLKTGKRYKLQCINKFYFDEEYSILIIEIEFTRFMKHEQIIHSGAMITNKYVGQVEDYMHKIDVDNYMEHVK